MVQTAENTQTAPSMGERLLAALTSFMSLSPVFPIAAVIGGLEAWLAQKRHPFLARHGLATVYWQAIVILVLLCLAVIVGTTHVLRQVDALRFSLITPTDFWNIQTTLGKALIAPFIAIFIINTLVALSGIFIALRGRRFLPMMLRSWPHTAR